MQVVKLAGGVLAIAMCAPPEGEVLAGAAVLLAAAAAAAVVVGVEVGVGVGGAVDVMGLGM